MVLKPMEVKDKRGQCIVLRSAEEADAEDMLRYMKYKDGSYADALWMAKEL